MKGFFMFCVLPEIVEDKRRMLAQRKSRAEEQSVLIDGFELSTAVSVLSECDYRLFHVRRLCLRS